MEVWKKKILNDFIWWNNSTQFVIPIYQRNYVWKRENVEQLLQDVENMINHLDDPSIYHFFWSIVYIDSVHRWFFQEFSIIDWQQRLTTIFLLLHALRIVFPESNNDISSTYLYNRESSVNKDDELSKYKLKPLVSDDNMYLKISRNDLLCLTEEEENSNIYKMFCIIRKTVSTRRENGYSVEDILNAMDKFLIVWIQLWANENPQQVFESINSTWVNLTAADLIRNYMLMNKNDEEQTYVYEHYREKIEFQHVKTENLKEFFRFYISIKKKETIPQNTVYELFKIEYKNLCKSQWESWEEIVLKDILDYAEAYWYIKNENSPLKWVINSPRIEEALKDFRNIESNMPILILMEAIKLYKENKILEYDTEQTIKLLTNYIVRRNLCWAETRYISWHFWYLLWRIENLYKDWCNFYEAVLKIIVAQQRNVWSYMPNDQAIFESFKKNDLYNKQMTSFVLKRIENNSNNIEYKNLTIEHVMPQHKTEYWESKINCWSIYEEVFNRVWNLTLAHFKDNSAMSNKDFESKKKVLQESKHIKMNEPILEKQEWTENDIDERWEELAKKFISIFPYPEIEDFEDNKEYHFYNEKRCQAKLIVSNWKFIVKAWAKLSEQITSNFDTVNKLRTKYAKSIENLTTTEDCEFDTPSWAWQFVNWSASAGRDDRVDENWNSLDKNLRKK